MSNKNAISVTTVSIHLLFILVSISMVVPMLLVVAISITEENALIHNGYQFIPKEFSFQSYQIIFKAPKIMLRAYGVTIVTTVLGTVGSLLLTAMVGYTISRRDYRYNRTTTFYVFFTMLFGGGLVPSYILITQYLHMKDTIWALIIPTMISPFFIMIMKGFLSKVPYEIVESAKIDGAGEWRIFFGIILPLSTPALATLGLFISFNYWNAWMSALLYINNEKLVPVQLLLVRMMENIEFLRRNPEIVAELNIDLSEFPNLSTRMAMTVVAAGPMMFVFPFFQRYFVKGLTVGSLKE